MSQQYDFSEYVKNLQWDLFQTIYTYTDIMKNSLTIPPRTIQDLHTKIQDLQNVIQANNSKIAELEENIKNHAATIKHKDGIIHNNQLKLTVLLEQINEIEAAKLQLENEMASKNSLIESLQEVQREFNKYKENKQAAESQKRKDIDFFEELKEKLEKRIRLESPASPQWEKWD